MIVLILQITYSTISFLFLCVTMTMYCCFICRPVATVLVQQGTLKKGCVLVCGDVWAQVRSLYNERGALINEAPPSTPVLATGWKDLPQIGHECFQVGC